MMDQTKHSGEGERLDDKMVQSILQLPHKILRHHDVNDLPQLLLHELSHDSNFGLHKAAYLVDNPEFDCLKGIAGFSKDECALHRENMWDSPHDFGNDMRDAGFYNTLKYFVQDTSVKRREVDIHNPEDLKDLGKRLGLANPSFLTWNMRHGNHGILLFEQCQMTCARRRDLLHHATALLSLC
jgi:hypothetical protein